MVQIKEKSKAGPRKKTSTRILKLVLLLIIILIVLVFFLIPIFMSSEKGRRLILGKINNSINGQVDFADLSMGWFKGVRIADLSFNDNIGQVSAQVKKITTKPHYGSIIMGDLSFGETAIDQPKVYINLQSQPAVKQESVGKAQPVLVKAGYIGLVMDLAINDGNVKVTDSKARTVELSQINSRLNLQPPGKQTDFDINLAVVDQKANQSPIHAVGKIKLGAAKKGWTLKGTTGDLIVEVNELDLETLGPIFELAKIEVQAKGFVSADVNAVIEDGNFEDLNGSIKAKNLDITGPVLKGDRLKTNMLDVVVKLTSQQQLINIEKLQLDSDWLTAEAGGMVPTTFKSWSDFLLAESDYKLNADFELDAAALLSQMPRTFAIRKTAKVTSGQLSGNVIAHRGKLASQVNLTDLAGIVEGKKLALSEPVTGRLQISADNNNKMNFDSLDVSSAFAKINASGSLEEIKYNGQVDLEKLLSELGQFVDLGAYKIAGLISEQGTLSVTKDKITGMGSSQVKNLHITSKAGVTAQEPGAELKFAFGFDRQDSVLSLDSLQADASFGQVNIEQAVFPIGDKPAVPMQLTVSANNVDLAKLKPFAVLFASLPKDMQLAGIAESKLTMSSEKNIYKITTDSTKITALKLTYPDKKPFEASEASLSFEAEFNPEQKSINIKELQLESPQIKIRKGQFNQSSDAGKTKLSGQAECEYEWSAVSSIAASYIPDGLTLQGKRKDTVSFTSEYPIDDANQLLPNLTANAKLGFEQAGYMGLNAGLTNFDIQIRNGLLKIAPLETTINEGKLNLAAQIDFKQKPSLLKINEPLHILKDIKINDQTTKMLLKYLNPIFADAANVSGVANLNCEKLNIPLSSAAKNHAEIIATVSIDNLSLQASDLLGQLFSITNINPGSANFTIRPTKFILHQGYLSYENMQLDVGDNPFNFRGTIGMDKSLKMEVILPYTTQGRTIKVGQESDRRRVRLPLKGTIDKIELDKGKLIESQLKQQLEDRLPKGILDLLK